MNTRLSLIVPCYNDWTAFAETINSLRNELNVDDHLIIIDSSDDRSHASLILNHGRKIRAQTTIIWTPPAGVYSAYNQGLQAASSQWIQILNSGDCYVVGARIQIDEAILNSSGASAHIFGQIAKQKNGGSYVYIAPDMGIWPTQSVIIERDVFDILGSFETKYKIISDQILFSALRKNFKFIMHKSVLTTYDLSGLSAQISWANSYETFILSRELGHGYFVSFSKGYLTPCLRIVIRTLFGDDFVVCLKRSLRPLFPNYSRDNDK